MSPPTNQHPAFYMPDALPVDQPTVSKHRRENIADERLMQYFNFNDRQMHTGLFIVENAAGTCSWSSSLAPRAAHCSQLLSSYDVWGEFADVNIFPVSEMTYTVSSGTLNSSIPYHTIPSASSYVCVCCSLSSCVCTRERNWEWQTDTHVDRLRHCILSVSYHGCCYSDQPRWFLPATNGRIGGWMHGWVMMMTPTIATPTISYPSYIWRVTKFYMNEWMNE